MVSQNPKERSTRMTKIQVDTLVDFMLTHMDFARDGDLGIRGRETKNRLWKCLSSLVSAKVGGYKSVEQCSRAWLGLRNRTLTKNSKLKRRLRETGNNPIPLKDQLTARDLNILEICGETISTGISGGSAGLPGQRPCRFISQQSGTSYDENHINPIPQSSAEYLSKVSDISMRSLIAQESYNSLLQEYLPAFAEGARALKVLPQIMENQEQLLKKLFEVQNNCRIFDISRSSSSEGNKPKNSTHFPGIEPPFNQGESFPDASSTTRLLKDNLEIDENKLRYAPRSTKTEVLEVLKEKSKVSDDCNILRFTEDDSNNNGFDSEYSSRSLDIAPSAIDEVKFDYQKVLLPIRKYDNKKKPQTNENSFSCKTTPILAQDDNSPGDPEISKGIDKYSSMMESKFEIGQPENESLSKKKYNPKSYSNTSKIERFFVQDNEIISNSNISGSSPTKDFHLKEIKHEATYNLENPKSSEQEKCLANIEKVSLPTKEKFVAIKVENANVPKIPLSLAPSNNIMSKSRIHDCRVNKLNSPSDSELLRYVEGDSHKIRKKISLKPNILRHSKKI